MFIHVWIGRISFTSHTPGEHTICLYSNSSAWFSGSQLRVHMDIQVGEHAIDYAQVAQKEKMTELQLRIRQLLNQVDQITKEQNYQRVSRPNLVTIFEKILMCHSFIPVSRRTIPTHQRKYEQTRALVVFGPSHCSRFDGLLADASSEDILRNKEISLNK